LLQEADSFATLKRIYYAVETACHAVPPQRKSDIDLKQSPYK
jgi:hypothetical protein